MDRYFTTRPDQKIDPRDFEELVDKELMEKCLLTGEERSKAMGDAIDKDPFLTYPTQSEKNSILFPAQVLKAIPIIRKELEAEHNRLVKVARAAGKADGFKDGQEGATGEIKRELGKWVQDKCHIPNMIGVANDDEYDMTVTGKEIRQLLSGKPSLEPKESTKEG